MTVTLARMALGQVLKAHSTRIDLRYPIPLESPRTNKDNYMTRIDLLYSTMQVTRR